MSFGIWDLQNAAKQGYQEGEFSVEAGIDGIFQALEYLTETELNGTRSKIIILTVPDLTLFPGYTTEAILQRRTATLVNLWNFVLKSRARMWVRGTIYVFDLHRFVLEQIRYRQLRESGMSDNMTASRDVPLFQNVDSACLVPIAHNVSSGEDECPNPLE